MELPELLENTPLLLAGGIEESIAQLELVAVDCTPEMIRELLHAEAVLKSAETAGLADFWPQDMTINSVSWRFGASSLYGWRLLVNIGELADPDAPNPYKFMLVPTDMAEVTLAKLGGRLPYLEFHSGENGVEHDTERDEVEIRGIELTAMFLLQGILPKGII